MKRKPPFRHVLVRLSCLCHHQFMQIYSTNTLKKHHVRCWLVNTGWSGGAYGRGSRIQIAHTRAMIQAALNGALDSVPTVPHAHFGMAVPQSCPDIPAGLLDPRKAWPDPHAYDQAAQNLTRLFAENFKKYEASVSPDVIAQTIRAA